MELALISCFFSGLPYFRIKKQKNKNLYLLKTKKLGWTIVFHFKTSGLILWYKTFVGIKFENIINNLIRNILLDQKRNQDYHNVNGTIMRWKVVNESGLIFLVAYQEAYGVLYVDQLLDFVTKDFLNSFNKNLKRNGKLYLETAGYSDSFTEILKKWEKFCKDKLESGNTNSGDYKKRATLKPSNNNNSNNNEKDRSAEGQETPNKKELEIGQQDYVEEKVVTNFGSLPSSSNIPKSKLKSRNSAPSSKKEAKQPPKGKEARKWDDQYEEANAKNIDFYDKSQTKNSQAKETEAPNRISAFLGEADPDNLNDESLDEADGSDVETTNSNTKTTSSGSGLFSRLTNSLKNYIGNKELTEEDLKPIMKTFVDLLTEKNVAKEIAESLCSSVTQSLLRTKTQSFTTIATTVKNSLKDNVAKILTPKQDFDVLRLALSAKKRGEPFKIVFIGVNGVGKSTNLAKVAYLLMKNGLKLLIAACDNFRSGAVEQLKTHCRALNVDLFEKGYKDDPAYICKEAIEEAKKSNYDCVLIDTAGRMQDNKKLMENLAKLVEINQPDVILFVGEALTGNDSVDQLRKFNQALIDYSKKEDPRTIDGILLTKFDTVDDKVGAALTMVYTTGKPIVYVGTGQKYTNLKRLNVNNVLNALFG